MDKQEKIRLIVEKFISYGSSCLMCEFYFFINDSERFEEYDHNRDVALRGLYDLLEDIL